MFKPHVAWSSGRRMVSAGPCSRNYSCCGKAAKKVKQAAKHSSWVKPHSGKCWTKSGKSPLTGYSQPQWFSLCLTITWSLSAAAPRPASSHKQPGTTAIWPAARTLIQSEVEVHTSSEKAPAYTWWEKELCKSHVRTGLHSPCLWTTHDHSGSTEQRQENTPHFSSVVCLRKKRLIFFFKVSKRFELTT